MGKQKRRRFTTKQKATILRRHLVDKVPVSDLCDEYKIQPSVFYGWQRQLMVNMESALEANGSGRRSSGQTVQLERKVEAKDKSQVVRVPPKAKTPANRLD